MTITQFFSSDFATEFPNVIFDNRAIQHCLYYTTRNHYSVDVTFFRYYINIKYANFLQSPENETKFINWFKDYALSVISESCNMTGRFV